jgi:hypothetical protein
MRYEISAPSYANGSGIYGLKADWKPPHIREQVAIGKEANIYRAVVGMFESEELAYRAVVCMSLIWRSHWNEPEEMYTGL